jgi:hypothetical protein
MNQPHPLIPKLREAIDAGDPAKINRVVRRIDRELQHPDVWGANRVADELGVRRSNMYGIDGLPDPAVQGDAGRLWSAYKIKAFAKQRKQQTTEGKANGKAR